jgi:hypothetical protein
VGQEDNIGKVSQGVPYRIPKIQIGQRQVSEYQEGGMPFGLGDGLAVTVAGVAVDPQAILKLNLSASLESIDYPS